MIALTIFHVGRFEFVSLIYKKKSEYCQNYLNMQLVEGEGPDSQGVRTEILKYSTEILDSHGSTIEIFIYVKYWTEACYRCTALSNQVPIFLLVTTSILRSK